MEPNTLALPQAYEPQDLTPSPDLESQKLKVPDAFIRRLEVEEQEQGIVSRALNDMSDFTFSSEVFKAPVHGMVEGVNQTITTLEHALKPVVENPVHLLAPEFEFALPHLPNVNAPQTVTGNLVSDVAQFALPFTWALKGMKALNVLSRAAQKAPGALAAGAGFIADSVAFDPYEERLCNLVADHGPELTKPIFEALKADKLDGEVEARLKRGVEGLALGGLTSGIIKLVQKMRWLKTHKERVTSSTGEAYEPDTSILQAASDLSYWSGHHHDEALIHKTILETAGSASHSDHFAALRELTEQHNGEVMTPGTSSIFMTKASERWVSILQSKGWADLPEAAKQDLESLFLKGEQDHWPESLKQAIDADKLKRQAATEAKVSANLDQEALSAKALGAPTLSVESTPVTHNVTADSGETLLSLQTHQVQAFQEALQNFDEETASRVIGRGINFANIASSDDTLKVMKTLQDVLADSINSVTGNTRTWADTNKIASIIGSSPENVTSSLNTLFNSSKLMDSQLRASGIYLQSLFETLRREAVKIDLGEAGAEQIANFVRLKTLTGETLKMYQGIKSNIARSLNTLKMPLYGKELSEKQLTEIFEAQGGVTNIRALAKAFASCPSNEELAKLVKPSFYEKARDAVLEYFMNSVLSGPSTHAVNIMSTAAHTLWQPLERFTAGLIMADKDLLLEGTYLTRGIFDSLKDIVRWTALGSSRHADETFTHANPLQGATKAFMADRNLINQHGINDVSRPKAISAERFGLRPLGSNPTESIMKAIEENNYAEAIRSSMIHGLDYLGKAINLPGRFLLAEDEFFKIINYRSSIRALAAREVKLSSQMGQEAQGLYETILANPKQYGNLHEKALAFADEVSFTTPLAEATLSHTLNQMAYKHPGLRFIIPFIRTPANILKFAHHRTPGLNLLSKQYRQELTSSDPMVQSRALGKLFGGWILWATAFSLAEDGVITGGVPKGKGEALRNTGRLPYSFALQQDDGTTKYVQFSRLDPFGMFFGLAADLHHIFHELPDAEKENLATASLIAISQNINTRGYLVGLTNLLNALSDGNRYGQRFAANYLSSLVPNVIKQHRKDVDSVQRLTPKNPFEDLESLISFYKSQLPGYSKELPARLNLFGEEVTYPSPLGQGLLKGIATSKNTKNPVAEEMFRLKMSGMPPMDEIEGISLSSEEHHDYIKLCAKPSPNMDLKKVLSTIMSSASYKQMPEGDENVEGHKQHAIKSVIQLYRKLGQAKLLEQYPELNAKVLEQRKKKIRGN
ncbi:MAG: hypothetical protein J0G29_02090 [Alphaproteobacteria bacterium]|nr:hypothetical protein [Alphaproteobacteria bacterium]OJV45221.1 MAG: hypothetical protein BGO28_00250 [Alphaproteobacteria bacterium 43-37]